MVDTVIVALPAEDDYVNKLSSQKAPHLTLMYLGEEFDEDHLEQAARYLKHIAETSLRKFGLSVDRRGTLGAKEADVLFFDKGWQTKEIKTVIGYLLADDGISLAYNQLKNKFPDWIPHLTMGYPDEPAKEDERDYPGIHYVNFDRIAIWTGDSEGPEFRLMDYPECADIAMSDEAAIGASFGEYLMSEEFLKHYGVPGMQWGKRKADSAAAAGSSAKAPKERGKIRRAITKANTANKAANEVIGKGHDKLIFLPQAKRDQVAAETKSAALEAASLVNKSSKFKGKDIKRDPELKAAYQKAIEKSLAVTYQDALAKARGEAAVDAVVAVMDARRQRIDMKARQSQVQHADNEMTEAKLTLSYEEDELGQIKSFEIVKDEVKHFEDVRDVLIHHGFEDVEIEQTDDLFKIVVSEEIFHSDEFAEFVLGDGLDELMHYGVPGMRWGHRKTQSATGVQLKTQAGKKVKATGGKFEEPSEDAKKVASIKQKAKKSSTDSLSNAELKQLLERMQLEASYDRLAKQSAGSEIVKRMFTDPKYRNKQTETLANITMPVRVGTGAVRGVRSAIDKTDLSGIGR